MVEAGGGTPAGAEAAARRLAGRGATALVSFGLAGGLDPALWPGSVIVARDVLSQGERFAADAAVAAAFGGITGQTVLAGTAVVANADSKRALFAATGAHAVDLESGAVVRVASDSGLPFAVVRAVCDPAERDLPPAALVALDSAGGIGLGPVFWSVVRRPGQIRGLLAVGRDAARARRSLMEVVERLANR